MGARIWAVAVLAIVALVAAACSDDDGEASTETATTTEASTSEAPTSTEEDPGDEPASSTTEAMELTASHRGVTADTIHVGVSLLDIDTLYEAGLNPSTWGDQELVWQTLLDDINARGGINGRMVEASIEFYNPANTASAEELCVKFGEDEELFAVLGGFLGPAEAATPCLTTNGDLMVVGGSLTDEFLASAQAAWYSEGRRDARTIPAFIDLLDREGMLDGAKVAVVSGDENVADTQSLLLPTLDEYGVEVVLEAVNDVAGTDIPAEDALWSVVAERIRASGADTVLINGDTTSGIRGISDNGLDVAIWVTDQGQLANLGDSVDRDAAEGAITIQGLTDTEAWAEPNMVECVETFLAVNPDADVKGPDEVGLEEPHWNTALGQACRIIALFELLAEAAGPVLTPDTIREGAATLTDFSLPTVPIASLGPDKPDANDGARLTIWDSTAGESGALVALTEFSDLTE